MHFPIIEPMFPNTDNQTDNTKAQPPSLAYIVREETQDGRLIVRFLLDVMQGLLVDFKPCHRLGAARQLSNLGFLQAQPFIDANTPASPTRKNLRAPGVLGVETATLHQELAALIREETDNGLTTVRFLVDVMEGNLPDFQPHHRLSAAKELLRRGFDAPAPETVDSANVDSPVAVDDLDNTTGSDPAEATAEPESPVFPEIPGPLDRYTGQYGPFDFRFYDEADYERDSHGDYARVYVLGGRDAAIAGTEAVLDFRRAARKVAVASGQDPEKSPDHFGTVPDDAPLPKDIYGYKVLLRTYGSEEAARVAAKGAANYLRKQAALAGNYPGLPPQDDVWDRPAEDEPPVDPSPPEPEPDAPKLTMFEEYMIQRRRERARNDRNNWDDDPPGLIYDRVTLPIIP